MITQNLSQWTKTNFLRNRSVIGVQRKEYALLGRGKIEKHSNQNSLRALYYFFFIYYMSYKIDVSPWSVFDQEVVKERFILAVE